MSQQFLWILLSVSVFVALLATTLCWGISGQVTLEAALGAFAVVPMINIPFCALVAYGWPMFFLTIFADMCFCVYVSYKAAESEKEEA